MYVSAIGEGEKVSTIEWTRQSNISTGKLVSVIHTMCMYVYAHVCTRHTAVHMCVLDTLPCTCVY